MMVSEQDVLAWSFTEAMRFYRPILEAGDRERQRWLCQMDRFFLLVFGMGREDACHPWIFARCREVQRQPEGFLDLWSRFHYKSTIVTLGGAIQEILRNPNITIGIFSNVVKLSKKFVGQIKRELERERLRALFPDILHARPPPSGWSAEFGLIVKRAANPKEPTVQAAGLVDGQPVGSHYDLRIYDDIVTPESVSTAEQIRKTTEAWELSLALGTIHGGRAWYVGTRYHPQDTYKELLDRHVLVERRHTCYEGDAERGRSVLMPEDKLSTLRREMGERVFASQMLQRPVGAGVRTFRDEWFRTISKMPARSGLNVYILVDSANSKKARSDYTTMWVVGLGRDKNYYVLDGVHERLNLSERTQAIFELVERWTPNGVWWEQVGLAADVEHIQEKQDDIGWHFAITAFAQRVAKPERIGWLVPCFEAGRIFFPERILRTDRRGELYDAVHDLATYEYSTHPICKHDDMLDCLANIRHPVVAAALRFPVAPRAEGRGQSGKTVFSYTPW